MDPTYCMDLRSSFPTGSHLASAFNTSNNEVHRLLKYLLPFCTSLMVRKAFLILSGQISVCDFYLLVIVLLLRSFRTCLTYSLYCKVLKLYMLPSLFFLDASTSLQIGCEHPGQVTRYTSVKMLALATSSPSCPTLTVT